ncbi:MAG TPA: glycosyltransferase family 87 protein [Anaerolineales bacterium]|nr:glycosyltransferase family 87 protein [Anaerolineales bacterium]
MRPVKRWIPILLGIPLIATYFSAFALDDLRRNTGAFEYVFFSAFMLYGIACLYILQLEKDESRLLPWIFGLAVVALASLTLTRPALSDDMYRYVWDGRVQAQGISPYRYPPSAPELAHLRDEEIYLSINRKDVVTVYPPAAQAVYALLWRIVPDNIQWFQVAMASGGLLAGILLVGLLRDLGRSPFRVLIYLWSPLLAFETAHAAHVDGLVLPLLVGAWWARVRERDGLVGVLLGVAAAMKFYPALLVPFLWRPQHPRGRWQMPLAFVSTLGAFYLPYWFTGGGSVLGFLPRYFRETFNISPLVSGLKHILVSLGWYSPDRITSIALGMIAIFAIWAMIKPALNAETAIRRCIVPIGIITLFSQNLFSWYMLWLLPLIAIFLEPSGKRLGVLAVPRLAAWTGWWLFCGLIALSYTFFIEWKPVKAAIHAQFLPLYALLLMDAARRFYKAFWPQRWPIVYAETRTEPSRSDGAESEVIA